MFNKKIPVAATLILVSILFTSCGSTDQALDDYQKNMTTFNDSLSSTTEAINAIDTTSPDATEQLLSYLDELDVIFKDLAAMEVPVQYSAIESLADEAGSYMTEAVSCYHAAFADGSYDDYNATLAQEDYKRAMTRVQYIGDILMGVMPEGENVTIIYGDDDTDSTTTTDDAGVEEAPETDTTNEVGTTTETEAAEDAEVGTVTE